MNLYLFATRTTVRGQHLCASEMQGARLGNSSTCPSSLGPGVIGQLIASKQDRQNVLEAPPRGGVERSPGTETNLQAATPVNDR
jgi:hypothetical protein